MRSFIVRARYTCVALASCAFIAGLFSPAASAKSASSVPALGTPTGNIVRVSTEEQLAAALRTLAPKTTVLVAPGVYRLAAPLTVGDVTDVVIRGESETAADVVIEGPGFLTGDGASVSHAFVIRGQRVTVANLTVRQFPAAAIVFEAGAASPRIYNVSSVDNKGTVESAASQRPVNGGTVEYSRFEYSSPAPAGSVAPAIAINGGSKWVVRHSLFQGLKGIDGTAEPAVLFRASVTSSVVESNTFVNSGREIVFGSLTQNATDATSGVIRNNFIVRDASSGPAAAITLAGSPGSRVVHNTILMNGSYSNAIELKFRGTVQALVRNNLLDAPVALLDGATGTIEPNDATATAAYFVNPAEGDLHLLPAATSAIDGATALSDAVVDWDGQTRPAGTAVDFGADELAARSPLNASSTSSSSSPDTTASTTTASDAELTLAATAAATATMPSPWQAQDIGNPTVAGSSTYDSATGTFSVKGPGEGIYKSSDQFRFVYQPLASDGEIVARIATLENTNQWAKAGVMVRQSLAANSANAMAYVSAKTGFNFQRRRTAGGTTIETTGALVRVPQWVRLVRSGSKFTAYGSANGTSWTLLGSDTISMSGTVYVGLAVSSQREGQLSTGTFTNVAVTASTTSSPVPSPWVSRDVGNPLPKGSASYNSGTFTISGGGADIWGASDQFHYVYQPLTGDGEITTRVVSLENTHVWAKAGVMVRASLEANAAYAYLLSSAAKGLSFQQRTGTGGSASTVASVSGPTSVWLRLVRKGSQLTASRSSDGTNWAVMGTTTLNLPNSVYVGLAVTSHNTSALTSATFNSVAVKASSTSNVPPTVSVTSPSAGQTFTAPATVTVSASASDSDGTISKVDFYVGSTLIGSDTTSPYSVSTGSLAAGTYSITAVAQDNAGARTTSAAVSITVGSTSTVPQTLSFTPSADHSIVTSYVFEVFPAGSDPSKVQPARTQDLGKPSVVNGQITANVGATIQALSSGSYFGTVRAVGTGGSSRSAPSNTFTR